jgi:histidinol-phosphate aminotransferase
VRPPYNVNVLTLAAADFMLEQRALLEEQAAQLRAERERLLGRAARIDRVTAFDSAANFILFRVEGGEAADRLFAALKARRILIKNVRACTRCWPGACASRSARRRERCLSCRIDRQPVGQR